MESPYTYITAFTVLSSIIGLIFTIIWIIIGWRAMRAHERLAENSSLMIHLLKNKPDGRHDKDAEQRKLYHIFLNEVPDAVSMPLTERQQLFKTWLNER